MTVAGRTVLDVGTGSGIVAIAAALAGARAVLAADVDPYAIVATRLNAAANGVDVETRLGDLTLLPPPAVDMLAIGDLFYDAATAARVLDFARQHQAAGASVLIGDPLRAHLPLPALDEVARYAVSELSGRSDDKSKPACVFRLRD
jgi:predicted nicotinamide N-methyase